MKRTIPLLALLALAGAVLARTATPAAAAGPSAIAVDKTIWLNTIGYVTTAAEQMPDSLYAYRPTKAVRSFGELVAHVAGSQHMFCAAATGDKPSAEDDVEKTAMTKAAILSALKSSTAYCQKAYAMADADALARPVQLFGMKINGMWAVLENTAHDSEHYGNIVTYFRMVGMVPPSSQPAPK